VARGAKIDTREMLDIAFVRRQMKISHVSDKDAFAAFLDGRGAFDVDLHCRKLDAFVAEHKIDANIYSEDLLPRANPQVANRPVYFGRVRRCALTISPDRIAPQLI
jgi:hypothetical protein